MFIKRASLQQNSIASQRIGEEANGSNRGIYCGTRLTSQQLFDGEILVSIKKI
ncbi:hypothetical protein THIOSC15_3010004 [uncultured Thiomicrorhabdus sp.]